MSKLVVHCRCGGTIKRWRCPVNGEYWECEQCFEQYVSVPVLQAHGDKQPLGWQPIMEMVN